MDRGKKRRKGRKEEGKKGGREKRKMKKGDLENKIQILIDQCALQF